MGEFPEHRREYFQWVLENTEIPDGAIIADIDAQTENNSYGVRAFYVDEPYTCRDCGKECVWTAREQQQYVEERGGNYYAHRIRCRDCHLQNQREKAEQKRHMEEIARRESGT